MQSGEPSRLPRLATDQVGDRHPILAAVTTPVAEQEGREGRVGDERHMRAAVTQARDDMLLRIHRLHRFQVVVRVVDQAGEDEALAVIGNQHVVGDFFRSLAGAFSDRGNAVVARRRVVQRIAEMEHPRVADPAEQGPGVELGQVVGEDFRPHIRIAHRGHALHQRQVGDPMIGPGPGKRVLAAGQAEQGADRTRRGDTANRQTVGGGLGGERQQVLPCLGPVVALVEGEHQRPTAGIHDPAHHSEFRCRIGGVPVGGHLDEPLPGVLQPHRDAHQLRLLGAQRGRVVTGQGLVGDGAGRRETKRAGPDGIGGDFPHALDVFLVGVFQVQRAVAHHIDSHRGVRQQGAEVDVVFATLQGGQILGERLPAPIQAFVQARAGQVLDAFHQRDNRVLGVLADRGETDAAIAHHHGRDAVPG